MSFTPNIPQTGQSLGQTQAAIQNNFTNYNTVVSQDHQAPNNSGQGKHIKSTYMVQGSAPISLINEIIAYGATANGNSEIFINRDGVATQYQLTGPASSLDGALLRGGTTSILGGLMFKWAVISQALGTTIYTWVTETGSAFHSTPLVYGILPIATATSATISAVTSTNFSITGGGTFQILAIGA